MRHQCDLGSDGSAVEGGVYVFWFWVIIHVLAPRSPGQLVQSRYLSIGLGAGLRPAQCVGTTGEPLAHSDGSKHRLPKFAFRDMPCGMGIANREDAAEAQAKSGNGKWN
jgi:hypothetical protein